LAEVVRIAVQEIERLRRSAVGEDAHKDVHAFALLGEFRAGRRDERSAITYAYDKFSGKVEKEFLNALVMALAAGIGAGNVEIHTL
jgi:hypothetical protein